MKGRAGGTKSGQKLTKNISMRSIFAALCFLSVLGGAQARAAFTGPDLSGVDVCEGVDAQEGPYTATAPLQLIPEQSVGTNGAYAFIKLGVPGYGAYPGHAAAQGAMAAMTTNPSSRAATTALRNALKNGPVPVNLGMNRLRGLFIL